MKWIYLGITILLVFFIWGNSLKDGKSSSTQSNKYVDVVEDAKDEVLPDNDISRSTLEDLVRSSAHFFEFFLLGIFSFLTFFCFLQNRKFISLFFSFLIALIDEVIQVFIPDRAFEVKDIFIDSAGIFAGFCIGILVLLMYKKIRKKENND